MRGNRLISWLLVAFGPTLFACAVADNSFVTTRDSGAHLSTDSGADASIDSTTDVRANPETGGVTADTRPDSRPDTSIADTPLAATDSGGDTLGTPDTPLGCVPVINEVQTAGTTAADEFVEIFNPCGAAIPMVGYKIIYRSHLNVLDASQANDSTTVYAFVAADVLPPLGHFVVGGAAFTGPKNASEPSATGDLAAAAGQVGLRDASGRLLDGVFYGMLPTTGTPAFLEGTPAPSPAKSSSIYRAPDGKDIDDNGVDFSAANPTPTPTAANPTS